MSLDNFREFHSRFVELFRIFGVVPIYFTDAEKKSLQLKPLYIGLITGFLGVYWTGVVSTFIFSHHHENNKISIISNWIQMIGNALALTTTLVCTVIQYKDMDKILDQFEKIDSDLCSVGQKVDYEKYLQKSKLIVLIHLSFLGFILCYDFYVSIHIYQMVTLWYWFVCITPMCFYSMGLLQAMFMISWIKCRCKLINQSLRTIEPNSNTDFPNSPMPSPAITVLSTENDQGFRTNRILSQTLTIDLMGKTGTKQKIDNEILEKLFTILNDLSMLSQQIDEYYGLVFLSTIGALFAITTIQVYYFFITGMNFDEKLNFSCWTLFVSLNRIILNMCLIIGITYICQRVSNEAKKILQNFKTLQIQKGMPLINELSIWVHSTVSSMKFSAFEFFTIDYNMLCGFMAALITYLVIFIQFYSISGDGERKNNLAYVPQNDPYSKKDF